MAKKNDFAAFLEKLDRFERKIRSRVLGKWHNRGIDFVTKYQSKNTPEEIMLLLESIEQDGLELFDRDFIRETVEETFYAFYDFMKKSDIFPHEEQSDMEERIRGYIDDLTDYIHGHFQEEIKQLKRDISHATEDFIHNFPNATEAILEGMAQSERILEYLMMFVNLFLPRNAVFIISSGMNAALLALARSMYPENTPEMFFRWHATLDPKTCETCWKRHGKIISSKNPLFVAVVPPVHPHCRCVLEPIYDEEVEEDDWTGMANMPTDFPRTWYRHFV